MPQRVELGLENQASYPFAFCFDGRTFCVPQTAAALVRLHKCIDGRWTEHCVIIDDVLLDPTVVLHDGLWWLFATRPGPSSLANLHKWRATDLPGPWLPHVANLVKCDVRSAQPSGKPLSMMVS